jgi:hypothetical protein
MVVSSAISSARRFVRSGACLALAVCLVSARVAHAHGADDSQARDAPPAVAASPTSVSRNLLGPSPMKTPPTKYSPWTWALMGVGALTLGTGVWLVYRDNHDVTPPCTTLPQERTTCPYATSTAWQGWSFVAVGAELAAAGLAWRIVEWRRHESPVSLAAGLDGFRLSGTF